MGFNVMGLEDMTWFSEAQVNQVAAYAQAAGAHWVRYQITWKILEPTRGQWDLAVTQRHRAVINAFNARGIQVLAILKRSPKWACDPANSLCQTFPTDSLEFMPDDLDAWQTFVRAAVDSFQTVTYWEIWNEPSSSQQLTVWNYPTQQSAYQALVQWAAGPIHDAGKKLVSASENEDFYRTMLQNVGSLIDVISVHSYHESWEVYGNIQTADAIGRQYRSGGYPIWLTETGDPANNQNPTDGQQAAQIAKMFQYQNAGGVSNWEKTFAWHLFAGYHPWDAPGFGFISSVLTAPNFRPGYYCYQSSANGYNDPTCTDSSECEWGDPKPALACLRARLVGPTEVPPGQQCTWNVIASSTSPVTYQWYANYQYAGSEDSYSTTLQEGQTVRLEIVVTDNFGRTTSRVRVVEGSSSAQECPY